MPGSSPDTWKFGGGSVLTGYILVQMKVVLARQRGAGYGAVDDTESQGLGSRI